MQNIPLTIHRYLNENRDFYRMEIRTNNACGCYRYTLATKLHRRQKKLFVGLLSTDTSVIRCFPGLSFAKETTSSTTMAKKGCQKFPWQNNQIENAKGELMPKTCKRIKLQFAKTILIFFSRLFFDTVDEWFSPLYSFYFVLRVGRAPELYICVSVLRLQFRRYFTVFFVLQLRSFHLNFVEC